MRASLRVPVTIEAMLDAVPDLRPAVETATGEELAAILGAFDVTITHDKASRRSTSPRRSRQGYPRKNPA
ncbi:MAG TPA: hypothetical protein VGW98_00575 [Solirubrobacteraceae bacterium]|jgi:hypothetical protein|nr:hypothetical protein [Solirubrobacteraceae bacterium]